MSQAILANDALWGRDLAIALALCLGQCSGPGLSIPAFYPPFEYICMMKWRPRAFSRVSTGDSDILSSCDMNDEHA